MSRVKRLVLTDRAWQALMLAFDGLTVSGLAQPSTTEPIEADDPVWQELLDAEAISQHPEVVDASGVAQIVNRSLLLGMLGVVMSPLRVTVSSWTGHKVVMSQICLNGPRGSSLSRRLVLSDDLSQEGLEPWVEFSGFEPSALMDELARALPPQLTAGRPGWGKDAEPVWVGTEMAIASASALRGGSDGLWNALLEVQGATVSDAGRELLTQLSTGLLASTHVTVRGIDQIDRGQLAFDGVWLFTAGGPVAALPVLGPQGEPGVQLTAVSPAELYVDMLLSITTALDALSAAAETEPGVPTDA